jgi:glucosamine-6-phosphate deaminase
MDRPCAIRKLMVDKLSVEVDAMRDDMGRAAACDVAVRMQQLLATQTRIRMVFAAAPSQNEFLATLSALGDLDWSRVEAFHMDEYLGLPPGAPQGFGHFLRERLFARVKPGRVEYIDGAAAPQDECTRYSALVQERPIDIVCAGIGENGHMAFNDPPVADFADPYTVKVVTLDEVCRMQQVHDGAFPTFDAVPQSALTLTMPALMSARWLYCMVPGPTKTVAVRRTLRDPIATTCPATIMRHHAGAVLYLDRDSAAQI